MTVTEPLQRWREELQLLQTQRTRLANAWADCLQELQQTGAPPEPWLMDEQSAYRDRLAALCAEISRDCPNVPAAQSASLDDLAQGMEDFAAKQQARGVLEQLLELQHVTEPSFEPLQVLQDQARNWLSAWSQPSTSDERLSEWKALSDGEHPVCDLLRWQSAGAQMEDHEWDRLQERVSDHFGRALATAVGRGRIVARSTAAAGKPEPVKSQEPKGQSQEPESRQDLPPALESRLSSLDSTSETVDWVPDVPSTEPCQTEPAAPEPSCVFDFTSTGSRMTGILDSELKRMMPMPSASPTGGPLLRDGLRQSESIGAPSPKEDAQPDSGLLEFWSQWRETRGRRREDAGVHQTPAAALAEAALMTAGEERVRCLFRLIDQLLIDDQLDLAFQFMSVLEGQPTIRLTPLPASLIRACLLSRHVCYPQGELSRLAEEDLRKQQPRRYQDFPADGRLAYEFLCRAAALLPALLCSSTSAVRLLQSFPIEKGQIQLYNYCSRIASYAERLQGKTGEMLQTGEIGAGSMQELAALRQSAQDWITKGLKQTVAYSRSSPLFLHAHWTVTAGTLQQAPEVAHAWSQWQETWLTVHRLLRPVILGSGSDRTWVKHEIERLTPALRGEAAKQGHVLLSGQGDAQAEMRGVLLQAIEFATGWLRLGGGSTVTASNLPIREMEELSAEIRERTPAVLEELRPFAGIQMTPTVRAGAFCLIRSVQRIHALFESQAALAWREPELRQLLHAELLKIPCLPLNDHWEPQVDADILETELLEHISRGAGSYREAFDLQCQHGDHVATGRLLEIPVWASPAEQADLAKLRQDRIAECRRELQSEVDDLTEEFAVLSAAEALAPVDRPIFSRRLERLKSTVSKTLDFPIANIQIQQLRLMLQRRSISAKVERPERKFENPAESAVVPSLDADARRAVPDAPAQAELTEGNTWVMDLLWEDH